MNGQVCPMHGEVCPDSVFVFCPMKGDVRNITVKKKIGKFLPSMG